jgi:catechol 2,3-dioxygenase-like lactoylglutathione lyase family enzyme
MASPCLSHWRLAAGGMSLPIHRLLPVRRRGACAVPREKLAEDAGVPARGAGFAGVTLAQNVDSREAVGRVLAEAVAAGATPVKPAQDTPRGGHSGYFDDPDGHPWEVAFNPFLTLGPDGALALPD